MTGTGNDVTGTGSDWKWEGHVIWDGKPLTGGKNGSWAQGGAKPLRKEGSKSKVQLSHRGRSMDSKKKKRRHVGKQKII